MVQGKWLIILGIVNVLAMAGIIFWYVNRDHTAPVITQEAEIVYEEMMSDSELLQGAVAYDEADGDVSHTLVVEKVTVNHNTGIAMVTYGAMDSSGNIAKESFRMAMTEAESSTEGSAGDRAEAVFTLEAGEAAIGNETDSDVEATDAEKTGDTDESEDVVTDEESEDDENPDEESEEESEEESDEEENQGEAAQQTPTPEEEAVIQQQTAEEAERPVINFSAAEVKTNKGYNPAWVTVISQMYDNHDSYEDLLGGIKISGDYNKEEVGNYDVTVTIVDSDGNESEARAIRIIVEE